MKAEVNIQAKREYCIAWEKSGMAKSVFCDKHGLSRVAFHAWYQQYKKGQLNEGMESSFSPMTIATSMPAIKNQESIPFEIRFPNQTQLVMTMSQHALVSFVQELAHATAITR